MYHSVQQKSVSSTADIPYNSFSQAYIYPDQELKLKQHLCFNPCILKTYAKIHFLSVPNFSVCWEPNLKLDGNNILQLEIRSVERGICPIATSTINERTVPIIMAECMAHEREAIFPLPV